MDVSALEPAADLAERQKARTPEAIARAQVKVAAADQNMRPVEALLVQASRAPRPGKRIRLLLQAASAWADQFAVLAACRRGCSHCCHLPLAITSAEARLLSTASGRNLRIPAHAVPVSDLLNADVLAGLDERQGRMGPCPFLGDEGECTVYAQRPAACRMHMNLDDDELLCRIAPGYVAEVPYADSRQLHATCLLLQPEEVLADIRDFFGKD